MDRREIEEKSGAEVKVSSSLLKMHKILSFGYKVRRKLFSGGRIWGGQVRGDHHWHREGKGESCGTGWEILVHKIY